LHISSINFGDDDYDPDKIISLVLTGCQPSLYVINWYPNHSDGAITWLRRVSKRCGVYGSRLSCE